MSTTIPQAQQELQELIAAWEAERSQLKTKMRERLLHYGWQRAASHGTKKGEYHGGNHGQVVCR
jgi:hypothetical protein